MTGSARQTFRMLACAMVGMLPGFAAASQGPGAGPGTASPWLQIAMAIVVYGGAGVLIVAGFVGAVRQR